MLGCLLRSEGHISMLPADTKICLAAYLGQRVIFQCCLQTHRHVYLDQRGTYFSVDWRQEDRLCCFLGPVGPISVLTGARNHMLNCLLAPDDQIQTLTGHRGACLIMILGQRGIVQC